MDNLCFQMEFLGLIAAVAALTWVAVAMIRGGLLAGCVVVLLTGCVFGAAFFTIPLKPIPVTVDRVLWLVLLVQFAVLRRLGIAEPRPFRRSDKVLLALLAVLAFSTLCNDWSAHNNQPAARLAFQWFMPAGLYFVARESNLSERSMKGLSISLGVFAVYLAVTAVAEIQQAWWAVFPQYIGTSEFKGFLGRGRGPLLNPAGNGFYMAVGLAAWLLTWPQANRGAAFRRGLSWLAVIGFTAICLLGAYATLTRCVWMGVALGVSVLLVFSVPKAWRMPVLGAGLLLASLLVVSQWESILAFKRDQHLSARETAESVKLRPILARVAWNMFCDRPVLGCGFAHYSDESIYYLHDRSTLLVLETARPYVQHNVLLSLLTETGIIGMGLFASLLACWTSSALRLCGCPTAPPWVRRQGLLFLALIGSYIPNAMFQDMSLVPMVNSLLFLMGGVTAGLESWARPTQSPQTENPS
jgi:hypothetical protein